MAADKLSERALDAGECGDRRSQSTRDRPPLEQIAGDHRLRAPQLDAGGAAGV